MAGNYGGSSIPTTPIDGATLAAAATTTYQYWECTSVYSVGTSAAFTYNGEVFTLPVIGDRLDMVINPSALSSVHAHAMFLCYECSCKSPFTGITTPSEYAVSSAMTTNLYRPTIIGGGGLNS